MRIMGIDPGLANCGWGVIFTADGEHACAYGCIHTRPGAADERRLGIIAFEIENLIKLYDPDVIAMEMVFMSRKCNVASTAEVRGVIKMIADRHGVPVIDVNPMLTKRTMCKKNRPSDDEMRQAVRYYLDLSLDETPTPFHACEALAHGMTAILEGMTGV